MRHRDVAGTCSRRLGARVGMKPRSLNCQPRGSPTPPLHTHPFVSGVGDLPLSRLDALAGEGGITGKKDSSLIAGMGQIGVCLSLVQEGNTKSCFPGVGRSWETLFHLNAMGEEESLLRQEWDGGDHSLLEPEYLSYPSPSLQHIHHTSPNYHHFSPGLQQQSSNWTQSLSSCLLPSSTQAAPVNFLKCTDHSVQGISSLAG